jgi:hypothetical protein
MPLLKDILRKNTEKSGPTPSGLFVRPKSKDKNGDSSSQAGSVHSVRSVAGSIASFFTARGIGGERIPKRRRPDASRLGAPTFYHRIQDVPREALVQVGTEEIPVNEIGGYSVAHGKSWMPPDGSPAWFSVVLYNYGKAGDPNPVYHPGSKLDTRIVFVILNQVLPSTYQRTSSSTSRKTYQPRLCLSFCLLHILFLHC